jgi:hypothetical protein
MHVLAEFIALTAIDDFAYCAVGFMVYSLFTLKASESFQLALELVQQQATGKTFFQFPYVHKHISSLKEIEAISGRISFYTRTHHNFGARKINNFLG